MFKFNRKDDKKDPESGKIWEAFRKAEDRDWCCRMITDLKGRIGPLSVTFTVDGTACNMPVRHCPRCGRKLY